MKTNENASLAILKIILISLVLVLALGIAVNATSTELTSVKVQFSNGSEINILTAKTKIAEILEEQHIKIEEDEKVKPGLEEELAENKQIIISKITEKEIEIAEQEEKKTIEELKEENAPIIEKIEIVEEEIPFETIKKDVSDNAKETTNKVLQKGKNGLRQVTYKVKYRNEKEIAREEIESKVIKKPVNKIVQINAKQTPSSRGGTSRLSSNAIAQKVANVTPKITTLNVSAYTASTCGKSPSSPGYGRTASGAMVTEWYTVAAGKGYPMGTVIYIPYFKNKPNGGWFVVQDRGGAISNTRLDVYMGTYNECIKFGRRNLECHIYVL